MDEQMTDVSDGYDNNCFDYYYRPTQRYLYQIRNLESWKGKTYVEVYDGPIDPQDRYWRLSLNLRAQPMNHFISWWNVKENLYYKEVKQDEIKKEAERICNKLINGYQRVLKFELNVPICITQFIELYLMVEPCVFKEMYVNNDTSTNATLIDTNDTKWKSLWKGPTGQEYKTSQQLYWYNYEFDFDENGKPIGKWPPEPRRSEDGKIQDTNAHPAINSLLLASIPSLSE